MRIELIEIKNYRSFRHAVFEDLPPMIVVVGANGTGKSTLLDVFSFFKDALTQNVAMAIARAKRSTRPLRGEPSGRILKKSTALPLTVGSWSWTADNISFRLQQRRGINGQTT